MKILREEVDTMQKAIDDVQAARKDAEGCHYMSYPVRAIELAEIRRKNAADCFAPKALEALRFTEASTEEALLILDNARDASLCPDDHTLLMAIDMAIQKLRPEPTPVHDAAALEQLAQQYPIDLPWMKPAGIVATGHAHGPPCSPLSCDGCEKCQEGGEVRRG